MNRETLEAKDPAAKFVGIYIETYRGYKIRIQRGTQWGTMRVFIAGEIHGVPYGHSNRDAVREARSARAYIDDSHERPDAYTWSRSA